MQTEERQKRIQEYLAKAEFASLEDLASIVSTSVSTVRRDLDALSDKGFLKRTHGGARALGSISDEYAFSAKETAQLAEKKAIGAACAALVQPRQTVIIDAGTTCFHVATHLEAKSPHIVTNSLPVAHHFSGSNKLEVVVSGGLIYPKLGVLVGPLAVAAFGQVQADIAVLSCGGVTGEGITNSHSLLIEIQLAMITAARKVILCVDHTKFGRQSITRLCGLEMIDSLITDRTPPAELSAALEAANVEVIVAGGPAPAEASEITSGVTGDETAPTRPQPGRSPRKQRSKKAPRPASAAPGAHPPASTVFEPEERDFID